MPHPDSEDGTQFSSCCWSDLKMAVCAGCHGVAVATGSSLTRKPICSGCRVAPLTTRVLLRSFRYVTQQIGQSLSVLDIGLAAGHVLDVLGIHDQDLEMTFEQVLDRLPELVGALAGNLRDLLACHSNFAQK
jgi:hypothetical protein